VKLARFLAHVDAIAGPVLATASVPAPVEAQQAKPRCTHQDLAASQVPAQSRDRTAWARRPAPQKRRSGAALTVSATRGSARDWPYHAAQVLGVGGARSSRPTTRS